MGVRVDLVLPVYNEAHVIADSIGRLRSFLSQNLADHEWRIIIADNASVDDTLQQSRRLAEEYEDVTVLHLGQKGRGRALKEAWLGSDAEILSYMDVDLSTELSHFRELLDPIAAGACDIAIGSRLAKDSRTTRSAQRELISRAYNLIVRTMMGSKIEDAQCGFKAVKRSVARRLLPLVEDTQWFFDSELLLLAEREGYRIRSVPVKWVEDPDTRVRIVSTARQDLQGLWRLRSGGLAAASRELARNRERAKDD